MYKTTSTHELPFTVTGMNFEEYFLLSKTAQCTLQQTDTLLCTKYTLLEHRTENKIIWILFSATEKSLCNLAKFT